MPISACLSLRGPDFEHPSASVKTAEGLGACEARNGGVTLKATSLLLVPRELRQSELPDAPVQRRSVYELYTVGRQSGQRDLDAHAPVAKRNSTRRGAFMFNSRTVARATGVFPQT